MITLIPTRGFIFERTIRSLKKNGITDFLTATGDIPDVQNSLVREAMKTYTNSILFIEDDMEIPEGAIQAMEKMDKAVVCVDYPMDNGYSTIAKKSEEILWCGLGCTLVKQGVLKALGDPWFDISYSWRIDSENPLKMTKIPNEYKYGGLDINFCIRVRELGYTIMQVPNMEAKHLRSPNIIKGNGNSGKYEVNELPSVTQRSNYG